MTRVEFMKTETGMAIKAFLKANGYPYNYSAFWQWVENDEGLYLTAKRMGVRL